MTPEKGWERSAEMVLERITEHTDALKTIDDRVRAVQTEVVALRSDMNGRVDLVEAKVRSTCAKIGKSDTCAEHTRNLSALEERVDQHAHQQRERFKGFGDVWTEINKLRAWVKKVNDAGLIDQTEGRVRWSLVFGVGGLGGLAVSIGAVLAQVFLK